MQAISYVSYIFNWLILEYVVAIIIAEAFLIFVKIPPCPPRPDFDASREKLQKLGEGEGTMTREEFTKMKQELEA